VHNSQDDSHIGGRQRTQGGHDSDIAGAASTNNIARVKWERFVASERGPRMTDNGEMPGPQGDEAHVQEPTVSAEGPEPVSWRAGIDADRRRRRRKSGDQRETLRRLTATAAVAAAGLTAILFAQTGQVGPGAVDSAIVSFINAFLPTAGLQPPSQAPGPSPGARPIVTTGGS
jgi:hypothetical protein